VGTLVSQHFQQGLPGSSLRVLKYPEPVVFDSDVFQIPGSTDQFFDSDFFNTWNWSFLNSDFFPNTQNFQFFE
jgi:hypothetical protein